MRKMLADGELTEAADGALRELIKHGYVWALRELFRMSPETERRFKSLCDSGELNEEIRKGLLRRILEGGTMMIQELLDVLLKTRVPLERLLKTEELRRLIKRGLATQGAINSANAHNLRILRGFQETVEQTGEEFRSEGLYRKFYKTMLAERVP